jgi:hypothetical protein
VTGEGGAGGDNSVTPGAAGTIEPAADAGTAGEPNDVQGGSSSGGKAGASSGGKAGAVSSGNAGAAGEDNAEAGAGPSKPSASDDGCSCSMLPSSQGKSSALLGLGLAALGLVRRRRSGK